MYKAPEGSEAIGFAVASFSDSVSPELVNPVLKKHGIAKDNIDPATWYPLQVLMDMYWQVKEQPGGASGLTAMGKAVASPLLQSVQIDSAEVFLEGVIHEVVKGSIRNAPEGFGDDIKKLGSTSYEITNNTATPNEFIYGYLWEAMRLLTPKGQSFNVIPQTMLDPDDKDGAIFNISWE
jgi:hypothetical protein